MADSFCMTCGAKLSAMEKLRGQSACGSCRSAGAAGMTGQVTTMVAVSGLVSVADVAGFKRMLGRLPGVRSVKVESSRTNRGGFDYLVTRAPQNDFCSILAVSLGSRAQVEADDGSVPERLRVTYTA
jgi:hypothetical protein